jgi:hypothetical protein
MSDNKAADDGDRGKAIDALQPQPSRGQGDTEEAGVKSLNDSELDEAARYLANGAEYPPMTPEMEKRIVKKIDSWMIPLVSTLRREEGTVRIADDLALASVCGDSRCGGQGRDWDCVVVRLPDGQSHGRAAVQLAGECPAPGCKCIGRVWSPQCSTASLTLSPATRWIRDHFLPRPPLPTRKIALHR